MTNIKESQSYNSEVDDSSSDLSISGDDNYNCTINELPIEVLEKIIGYLKPQDLRRCRLISSEWKSISEYTMEQQILSFFTKWNLQKNYYELYHVIPTLWINLNPQKLRPNDLFDNLMEYLNSRGQLTQEEFKFFNTMFCPPKIANYRRNPFPSNSLRFGWTTRKEVSRSKVEIKMDPFFQKHGSYLTTFILDGYRETPQKFSKLLSHFPNLKSLTCQGVDIFEEDATDWITCELPALPHLTHLRLSSSSANFPCTMAREPLLWILEKYAEQLVGLSVFGDDFLYRDEFKKLQWNIQFLSLRELKIDPKNRSFLQLTQGATSTSTLSHIEIVVSPEDKDVSFAWLFPNIFAFSKTLVYLRIPNIIGCFEGATGVVGFPLLKSFGVRLPTSEYETWVMKSLILPLFPRLEKLEFICYSAVRPGVIREIKKEEYWKVCSSLKIISVFDDRPSCEGNSERYHIVWSLN